MRVVKKEKNSEDLLFKHFMLDMSLRQNDPLCALFDALDVIYDEYCKQGKKIKDIGLFLLGIKLKIDYFSREGLFFVFRLLIKEFFRKLETYMRDNLIVMCFFS